MTSTIITEGQSLPDVALQQLGSVAVLFDLADLNELAITDQLAAGQVVAVPTSDNGLPNIASYFLQKHIRINTGDVPANLLPTRPVRPPHDWDFPDFDNQDFDA